MDNRTLLSSIGKWLAPICTNMFTTAVAECQQDKYAKKLTTTVYLKLFLLAQLHNREGLHHIADDVLCEDLRRELGPTSISARLRSPVVSISKSIPSYCGTGSSGWRSSYCHARARVAAVIR